MINSVIHETILRDIVDVITDVKDEYNDAKSAVTGSKGGTNFTSIARASSNLVLVFPFMCDSTVSMETASMTAKAIERQCVSMLRLLFSAIEISSAQNAMDYLAQFHKNIDAGSMGLDDFIDMIDGLAESGDVVIKDASVYNTIREEVSMMYTTANAYLAESVNEESLMDYSIIDRYGSINVLKEAKNSRKNRAAAQGNAMENYIKHSKMMNTYGVGSHSNNSRNAGRTSNVNVKVDPIKFGNNVKVDPVKVGNVKVDPVKFGNNVKVDPVRVGNVKVDPVKFNANINLNMNQGGSGKSDLDDPAKLAQMYKNMADMQSNMMLDGDVKKANELMPSMMIVNYVCKDDDGQPIPSQFVCGVKCRLIPVDPVDIANRILIKHSDKNVLTNFIRATTGEISFVRDFLFAIDKAKIDAMSQSRKGSSNKMWKVLERRSNKSKFRRYFSKTNDAAMITTLGISAELAEYIKKENGINLDNVNEVRKIMEGYNLMGFVIIDEAVEADKFLWDTGEGYYETISFNNLERENSGGEYKKALNLMQKMYR